MKKQHADLLEDIVRLLDAGQFRPDDRRAIEKAIDGLAAAAAALDSQTTQVMSTALAYINHVATNRTERGERHPQALLVQQMTDLLAQDRPDVVASDRTASYDNPALAYLRVDDSVEMTLKSGVKVRGVVGETETMRLVVMSSHEARDEYLILADEVAMVTTFGKYEPVAA